MAVSDAGVLEGHGERSLIELRIAPRTGEAADVDQRLYTGLLQARDKLLGRTSTVADGKDAR
jgi:hypothetical protein